MVAVDLLQSEDVGIQAAHAVCEPLRVHPVPDGAAMQDVEGRYAHNFSIPALGRVLTLAGLPR